MYKEGNHDCDHNWEYDDAVILTNPPMCHKICTKCGRVEHETSTLPQPSRFMELYTDFWGGKR